MPELLASDTANYVRIALELDGHKWHRRTAPEAQYEARRERVLVEAGWTLVRYMGAEVMREPGRVARAVHDRMTSGLRPGLSSPRVEPGAVKRGSTR